MKRPNASRWVWLALLLVGAVGYSIGTAEGRPSPPLQGADAVRWHVVTNPNDPSKTFLVDSLAGETFIFTSSGDSFLWKRIDRGK